MDVSHRFQYFDKLFKYEHHFPLQCSCLENSTDRGAWRAIVHEVAKSWTPSTHVQGRRPAKWSCPAVFLPPSLPGTQKSREWVQHCLSVNADFDTGVPWLSLFPPTVKLKRPALPASLPLGILISSLAELPLPSRTFHSIPLSILSHILFPLLRMLSLIFLPDELLLILQNPGSGSPHLFSIGCLAQAPPCLPQHSKN